MDKLLWFGVVVLAVTCVVAAFTEAASVVSLVALVGEFVLIGFIAVLQKLDDVINKPKND